MELVTLSLLAALYASVLFVHSLRHVASITSFNLNIFVVFVNFFKK